jgi:hypothetical protein
MHSCRFRPRLPASVCARASPAAGVPGRRNGDARYALGENHSSDSQTCGLKRCHECLIRCKALDVRFEKRILDLDGQIADPQIE